MMGKIVVLDAHITDCDGKYNWRDLKELAKNHRHEVVIHNKTSPEQVVSQASGANILVVSGFTPLNAATLEQLSPTLKYVMTASTGYDRIDVAKAEELGITVTNSPDYGTKPVADHTMHLMLDITRSGIHDNKKLVIADQWHAAIQAVLSNPPQELSGKTLGIVGLGRIGSAVAKRASSFDMDVLVYTRTPNKIINGVDIKYCSTIEELMEKSDIVTLHCELNNDTRRIINERTLSHMKQSAYLINTSRGELVDEQALLIALKNQKIAGAALDVLTNETTSPNALTRLQNTTITSHVASISDKARERLFNTVTESVRGFLNELPDNVIALPSRNNGHRVTRQETPPPPITLLPCVVPSVVPIRSL